MSNDNDIVKSDLEFYYRGVTEKILTKIYLVPLLRQNCICKSGSCHVLTIVK